MPSSGNFSDQRNTRLAYLDGRVGLAYLWSEKFSEDGISVPKHVGDQYLS